MRDLQTMVQRYLKYCEWAKRSGYTALDWKEYKQSRKHLYNI